MVDGKWLIDGAVVDPVPVGIARAMGADVIVAVDLNTRIVSHHRDGLSSKQIKKDDSLFVEETNKEELKRHPIIDKISAYLGNIESLFKDRNNSLQQEVASTPEIIETVMAAIGIMEERITRMNLAVDRPDILIQPRLGEMKMLNFDQVAHAIEEGYKGAQEKLEDILSMIQ